MKDEKIMQEIEKMMEEQKSGYDAVITGVEKTDSYTYFETDQYENREGYKITLEIDVPNGETWDEFFGIPKARGFSQSNIGAFCKKYDKPPTVGMKVKAELAENGFFRIVL